MKEKPPSIRAKAYRPPIIGVLLKQGICFAVMAELIAMKMKSIDEHSKEYSILLHPKDRAVLKGRKHRYLKRYDVCQYYLTEPESLEFKAVKNERFVKVYHSVVSGKIFELKDYSFKTMRDSLKQDKAA